MGPRRPKDAAYDEDEDYEEDDEDEEEEEDEDEDDEEEEVWQVGASACGSS